MTLEYRSGMKIYGGNIWFTFFPITSMPHVTLCSKSFRKHINMKPFHVQQFAVDHIISKNLALLIMK